MAYISEGEDELLRQQGMSGGGGSAPATRAPTKSGSWTNLNKYMGASGAAGDAVINPIESQRSALAQETERIGGQSQQLTDMLNNPNQYTSEQYNSATSYRPNDAFSSDASNVSANANKLGTTEGRFELLKNIQQPNATAGVSKLNQYLISRGEGADKIGAYSQKTPEQIAQMSKQYGENITGIEKGKSDISSFINTSQKKISEDEQAMQSIKTLESDYNSMPDTIQSYRQEYIINPDGTSGIKNIPITIPNPQKQAMGKMISDWRSAYKPISETDRAKMLALKKITGVQ